MVARIQVIQIIRLMNNVLQSQLNLRCIFLTICKEQTVMLWLITGFLPYDLSNY
jgi:hypothetical protein